MRILSDIESRPPVHVEFTHQELVELHKVICQEEKGGEAFSSFSDDSVVTAVEFAELLCNYWDEENK